MPSVGRPHILDGRTGQTPGPATTTPAVIDVPGDVTNRTFTHFFRIKNLSASGNLLVSLNGLGKLTLKPGEFLELPAVVQSLTVEASAGTVEWDAVAVI